MVQSSCKRYTAISQFLMTDIAFNIACKELKIAQIAQLNQLFQLSTFAFSSYILPRLLCVKSYANEENVNNDVSKDSPIDNNKSEFVSTIFLLPELHCSRKLISIVSRPRPLPESRLASHVTKTHNS